MKDEFFKSLNKKSAWIFTKQETDFDESFKATKLFADVCEREEINIENYFAEHSAKYGISTDRHRMLILPQLFGLITKTPFYTRGGQYNKERPTEIFDLIKNCNIGDRLYNEVKTEQLLKIKIHAIIDTTNNNKGYNVLPVLFIYKVLKKLCDKYGIKSISTNFLWTYVMTCKSYDQIDEAVENIKINLEINNPKIFEYVKDFEL
ncbi:MAG: hypothetical protein FWC41_12775 [Firmicutes bacterium]|nr:hypothetical protein [Bacillota bacterium]